MPKIWATLVAIVLPLVLCSVKAQGEPPRSQPQSRREGASADFLVIQGRITAIQGTLLNVKTPDGYPGGPGVHAQVVIAGPTFKVDISRARVLWADGNQPDTRPLAVGDRVVMVVSGPRPGSIAPSPQSLNQTYFASVVERIVAGDRAITH